jgi:PAS domain S-box-containing protein
MDPIHIITPAGAILEVNPAWLRMFGYSAEELPSLNAKDIYATPSDREVFLQRIAREGLVRDSVRLRRKDGTVLNCERISFAFRDDTGSLIGYEGILRDVTALQHAEEREKQQRVFSDALMETSPACVLVFDVNRKVVFANAETDRVLGLSPEQVLGKTCGEDFLLLAPAGTPLSSDELPVCRVFLAEQPLYAVEYAFDSPTGRRILSVSAAPLYDEEGAVTRVVATVEDITAAKHREHELRESEVRYRSLFEQTLDAVALVAVDGTVLEANPAFLKMFGVESIARMNAVNHYLDPDERRQFVARMQRDGQVVDEEQTLRRVDGSLMTCLRSSVVRRDASGQIIGYQTVLHDITERKRTEKALRDSEEKYHALFEQSMDAVALVAVDGTLLEANQAYLDLYGYDRSVIGALNVTAHMVEPVERAGFLERLDAAGVVIDEEIKRRKADGTVIDCLRSAIARRDDAGRLVALQTVIRDITERKQRDREREESVARLEKAMRATVEAMSAAVEMRDPYTAGHQRRVTAVARALALELGIEGDSLEALTLGSQLHDLGKLHIPAEILSKPRALTPSELMLVREHVQSSYDLLKGIDFPWPVADIAYQHHERLDGSGYPRGLKGDQMLPEARILAVADVFEAMSSHRPYRPALGSEAAISELLAHRGTLYDADAVDACVRLVREKGFTLD